MREPGRKASQTGSAPERARGKVAHAPLGIGGSLVPGRLDRGFGTAPLSPVPGAEDIGVQRAGVLTRRGRAAAQWTCASRRRKEQTDLVFGYHLLLGLGRECAVVCQLQPLPLRGPAVSQKTPGSRRESERKSSGPDELGGVAHRKAPRPGAAVPPPASFGHRAAPSLLLAPRQRVMSLDRAHLSGRRRQRRTRSPSLCLAIEMPCIAAALDYECLLHSNTPVINSTHQPWQ